ncbi:hypothetical protein BJ508DRAFT_330194 [Ascobolus immersus RN42]|uniref:Nicotinamide-nucleotide adenylyltransferase n=1 Tax=Ascobolus immersus RN42 TaxID=1160509 RepID=A0A3N4HUX6_ASCIM|nr:hypothetical protein BJ508DRAFT_330194 [Ascobolus immersus RN42]
MSTSPPPHPLASTTLESITSSLTSTDLSQPDTLLTFPRSFPKSASHLVILDSSFNPPTIAHAALATSGISFLSTTKPSSPRLPTPKEQMALLLLYSAKNADKQSAPLKPEERLFLAAKMGVHLARTPEVEGAEVAVGLCTEPLFLRKLELLKSYYDSKGITRYTFLVGWDTLIRIFNPVYYNQPLKEALAPFFEGGGEFLCFLRGELSEVDRATWPARIREAGGREGVFVERLPGREEEVGRLERVSSTGVREAVGRGEWGRVREWCVAEVAEVVEERFQEAWKS